MTSTSRRRFLALLVYRVDAVNGVLAQVQRLPSGGQAPWSFALHASGRWPLVAHQKSGTVSVTVVP
jgi:6-phosphogluconolactonase